MGPKGWVCWISVPEGLMTLGINHGYEGRKDMSSLSSSARRILGNDQRERLEIAARDICNMPAMV